MTKRPPQSTQKKSKTKDKKNEKALRIFEAYERLDKDEDWEPLRKTAQWLLGGTEFSEVHDLINEAVFRMANGTRTWPPAVPFPVALAMCMKSLSSHDRRAMGFRRNKFCSIDDMTSALVDSGEFCRSAEDVFVAAETFREHALAVNKERAAMRDDPIAKMVFNGIIDGSSTPEMRLRHKLSHAEFKAARQRAMRRIERAFGPSSGSQPEPARSRPHPAPRGDVRSRRNSEHPDRGFHA